MVVREVGFGEGFIAWFVEVYHTAKCYHFKCLITNYQWEYQPGGFSTQFWLEQFEKTPKFDVFLALRFVEAGLQRQFDMDCDGGSQAENLSGT